MAVCPVSLEGGSFFYIYMYKNVANDSHNSSGSRIKDIEAGLMFLLLSPVL